jgi:hypothetical protein
MPAKRLPWFKVWVGATRHEKVATLSDTDFRTWVELLDAAAQQSTRGKFDSAASAAAVVRRPLASVKRLIATRLLDDRGAEGLWLHDWPEWQRWVPDDGASDSASTPEPPLNNTRTTHEQHANVNGTTRDLPSRGAERAKTEKGDVEEDVNDGPPAAPQRPPGVRAAVPKPIPKHLPADAEFVETLVAEYGGKIGGPLVVREEVEAALNHTASTKCLDQRQYLRTWLNREVRRGPPRHTRASPTVPLRSVGIAPDVPPDSPFLKFREVS